MSVSLNPHKHSFNKLEGKTGISIRVTPSFFLEVQDGDIKGELHGL